MTPRQRAWPRQWLMTDERMGDRLWEAVARLPDGDGGIVLRHHPIPCSQRRALAVDLAAACADRGLTFGVARDSELAEAVGADFVHNPETVGSGPFSMSVHDMGQAEDARRRGAAMVFISPVFPTRSHPGAAALGLDAATALAKAAGAPAIALGGMSVAVFAALPPGTFYGWAAIDAWLSGPGN